MSERLAVLSDVHGNRVALAAVLAEVDALGVDGIVVAGDLSGFGPAPDDVVDVLRERNARMIRGNHEKDYVAPWGGPAMPSWWATSVKLITMRWTMECLGPHRRAFLAGLPDRLLLDDVTLVVHGSPRHVRDAVTAHAPEAELEAMFAGESCRLAFSGHSHKAVIRDLPRRRLVNVGSVGLPLDRDTRASYALIAPGGDSWDVELRRVPYDLEEAIADYARRDYCGDPRFVEIFRRSLRTARDYFGPCLRATNDVAEDEYQNAVDAYLAANP